MIRRQTISLAELFAAHYRPRRLLGRSPTTSLQYGIQIRHLARHLGHEPTLDDLDDETVAAFLERFAEGRTPATVNKARSHLLALWRFAHGRGLVAIGPDIDRLPEPERTPQAWSVDDLRRLFDAAAKMPGELQGVPAGLWWVALLRVMWSTGERRSALLAAQWSWLDRASGVLLVPSQTRKGGRKAMSYRLDPPALEALDAIRRPPREIIWPWPFCRETYWLHWSRLLRLAGLPDGRKRKSHSLRVSHASHLERAGGDATRDMRHASRAVTERSYLDPRITGASGAADLLPRV